MPSEDGGQSTGDIGIGFATSADLAEPITQRLRSVAIADTCDLDSRSMPATGGNLIGCNDGIHSNINKKRSTGDLGHTSGYS